MDEKEPLDVRVLKDLRKRFSNRVSLEVTIEDDILIIIASVEIEAYHGNMVPYYIPKLYSVRELKEFTAQAYSMILTHFCVSCATEFGALNYLSSDENVG